ncbi:hypothetical protein OJJOAM_000240 [Cupriavidus sp. H18C1]|uniref:hypothetical protein n=1 Tax=Cupriavidus sp. H18C1 TaxID=3241601 RepID=UPI003BB97E9B
MGDWDTVQPQSYYTDPMVSAAPSAGDLNPLAQTGADLLRYGLSRLIDVQTVRALQNTNTAAVLNSNGAVISTAPRGATPALGLFGGGMVPLLVAGGLIWLLVGKN